MTYLSLNQSTHLVMDIQSSNFRHSPGNIPPLTRSLGELSERETGAPRVGGSPGITEPHYLITILLHGASLFKITVNCLNLTY